MILQDTTLQSQPETLFEHAIRLLNYPFINQKEFQVSVLSLALFFLLIVIAVTVSKLVRSILERRVLPRFGNIDDGLRYTLLRVLHYLIIVAGFLYGLKLGFSVDLTSIAVILSFLSVGVGFGLQYVAADVISGFILLFERPAHVGDRLKLDDGIEGRVEHINIRSTTIITNENMAVIVPNSKLVQNKFVNYSHGEPNVRLNIAVPVATGSDIDNVDRALIEAAKSVDSVLDSPPPRVHFAGITETALNFEIRVWINEPHRHPQIRSAVNFAIARMFEKYNIATPVPQLAVNLTSTAASSQEAARSRQ
ncbi:MAG TPA: mechanosensitive ion channel domain-containing protein [Blastocatellia bacterium]|nr:mechanosensitive ion channel domain-containing protein [Blastocatellia bacterium]